MLRTIRDFQVLFCERACYAGIPMHRYVCEGRFAKICGVLPCCFIRRTESGCWFFQTERELGALFSKSRYNLVKISLVILSKRQYHRE